MEPRKSLPEFLNSAVPPRLSASCLAGTLRIRGKKELLAYRQPDLLRLTRREIQVLDLVAHGHTNRDIALRLGLSTNTVRNYLQAVFVKLEVENRTEAVVTLLCLEADLATKNRSNGNRSTSTEASQASSVPCSSDSAPA